MLPPPSGTWPPRRAANLLAATELEEIGTTLEVLELI